MGFVPLNLFLSQKRLLETNPPKEPDFDIDIDIDIDKLTANAEFIDLNLVRKLERSWKGGRYKTLTLGVDDIALQWERTRSRRRQREDGTSEQPFKKKIV